MYAVCMYAMNPTSATRLKTSGARVVVGTSAFTNGTARRKGSNIVLRAQVLTAGRHVVVLRCVLRNSHLALAVGNPGL